jgi:hypothetical protein
MQRVSCWRKAKYPHSANVRTTELVGVVSVAMKRRNENRLSGTTWGLHGVYVASSTFTVRSAQCDRDAWTCWTRQGTEAAFCTWQDTKRVYCTTRGSLMRPISIWMELSTSKMFDSLLQNIHTSFSKETTTAKELLRGFTHTLFFPWHGQPWPCCVTSCRNVLRLGCRLMPSDFCKMRPGHRQLICSLVFRVKPFVPEWFIFVFRGCHNRGHVWPPHSPDNPLRPSGNNMNHLLWQSVMLLFVLLVLHGSHCKQRLFT